MDFQRTLLTVLHRARGYCLSVFIPNICLGCDCLLQNDNINITANNQYRDSTAILLMQKFFCDICKDKISKYFITQECCKKCGYPIKKENFLCFL